ncbi:MAG: hypothetical protein A2268_12830 [Candidatus Raymondbacteria bacterium RifOxyA12_full_50_37]|uniref:Type II/III secretion system secretin-like domain-containing protein n=1 Tax=Candidatus Raymondbacteria bacterium RIFOXYD12_FULL_49_13 TaxID=1817890 RepID=A0A1F7FJP5_UNCRA|nr:MAG: hypothetical protein A2268_12830 [Candidatus Raymondbacteria bacterium RifOxyA12_full_50_37]OGJ90779.1 MAG: hypothetical protein A2248_02160 [Candidatus Raymondbacteria bacterium RIFOXYA2_FULL_49_16]OGJ91658.1 MAG: hypothetical protein A2350_00445 [Candidatus Raymondbacteria bacterium RifOxyB12_full_50_8]OGJ97273.1 MAG: hypothetical protein A2487_16350 [Candidatus Raymondbacteria bacterium RifOxyC12_full_50_8]OGJ97346.1 MAG: hypothetical protein A2453_03440 [Candidatus Raymondbacteria b
MTEKQDLPVPDSIKISSLNLKNADIRDVLRGFGEKYGLNIWLSPEVNGVIPIHLTNIKLKDAIKFIVTRYGFSFRVRNNIIEIFKEIPKPEELPAAPVKMVLRNDRISFELTNVPLDSVTRKYTQLTNINVVAEKGLSGGITGFLTNLEKKEGFKILMGSNGFDIKESGGIFYVMKKESESQLGSKAVGRGQNSVVRIIDKRQIGFEANNASLKQLLEEIALQANMNIFFFGTIEGSVTANIDTLNIDKAIEFLLSNTKYTLWKDGEVYFIGDESQKKITNYELIKLSNLKADQILELLPKSVIEQAVLKVIKEQNGIMVIGSYDIIRACREYIALIDKPVPQILIEALVVDFSISRMDETGVKAFLQASGDSSIFKRQISPKIALQARGEDVNGYLSKASDFLGLKQIVKLPSDFRAQINLLESQGLANVQSTPQVATLNGHTALIKIGTREYILLTSEIESGDNTLRHQTTERLESYEANISLSVTPWVTSNDQVTVEIKPIFQIPGVSPMPGKIPPPINTREITATVRLKNGETYILGGLISTNQQEVIERVPILGRIPVLRFFFSHKTKREVKTKMMIFLTPHIYFGSDANVKHEEIIKEWQLAK